ncbi:SAM-dependent methyltransferase [Faunimonas sp. B44]|uniref:SAM-dependent methyltransferase n=1 Tax=Faunimonas sp. B44 TaxID=3461493 RepID=UPI00404449E9
MPAVSLSRSRQAPARVAPLAVLPVFLDLRGRRALVAGGSDAAAWKAELLAAAGAQVLVHAPAATLQAEFRRLLAAPAGAGRIEHRDRCWTADSFDGAAVAVADAENDEEAEAFSRAARAAGVPVNVIDRPAFCAFRFGSIVNRSPVVVGISTSGAAPILGQAVRRRIEAVLPIALARWAELAAGIREAALARLAPGASRRAFWEAFADRAFGTAPGPEDAGAVMADLASCAGGEPQAGWITFVGAGPGDPELLTLKAVRALQAADLILFDESVPASVLELARREARRIRVRERSLPTGSAELGSLLAQAAGGTRVVRLVPGDPAGSARVAALLHRLRAAGARADAVAGLPAGGGEASVSCDRGRFRLRRYPDHGRRMVVAS